jgi:hypothetical protein
LPKISHPVARVKVKERGKERAKEKGKGKEKVVSIEELTDLLLMAKLVITVVSLVTLQEIVRVMRNAMLADKLIILFVIALTRTKLVPSVEKLDM